MSEVERIEDVKVIHCYDTHCRKCGREFWLHYNGGELDVVYCCGFRYTLEEQRIDFVVYEDD